VTEINECYKQLYEELTSVKSVTPETPEWSFICEYELSKNETKLERLYLACRAKESLHKNWNKIFPINLEEELEKNRLEQKEIETELKELRSNYLKIKLMTSLTKFCQQSQKQS